MNCALLVARHILRLADHPAGVFFEEDRDGHEVRKYFHRLALGVLAGLETANDASAVADLRVLIGELSAPQQFVGQDVFDMLAEHISRRVYVISTGLQSEQVFSVTEYGPQESMEDPYWVFFHGGHFQFVIPEGEVVLLKADASVAAEARESGILGCHYVLYSIGEGGIY